MKKSELKTKTKIELQNLFHEYKEKLRNLHFNIQLKQSKNVREIRKTRKLIAQILTFINHKNNQK